MFKEEERMQNKEKKNNIEKQLMTKIKN